MKFFDIRSIRPLQIFPIILCECEFRISKDFDLAVVKNINRYVDFFSVYSLL